MHAHDVLEVLVEVSGARRAAPEPVESRHLVSRLTAGRLTDARHVGACLQGLQQGGLVEMRRGRWQPTARGFQVDRLIASATVRRGGIFRPLAELGLPRSEMLALLRRVDPLWKRGYRR